MQSVAACILKSCRKSDIAGRVGGEELSTFLPETNLDGALALAEKMRITIEKTAIQVDGNSIKVTVSVGVATKKHNKQSVSDILQEADMAMYRAKKDGRNRVSYYR